MTRLCRRLSRFLARNLECMSASRNSLLTRSPAFRRFLQPLSFAEKRVSRATLKRGLSKKRRKVGLGPGPPNRGGQGTMRLAEESGRVAEKRRCLGDARMSVGRGCLDVGLDPLRYDHRADQGLDGHVSRLRFELQLPVVFVPH